METPIQSMAVQHFSVEIDFHMSKNMRFGSFLHIQHGSILVLFHAEDSQACMQVEFNKAAQSLTDAILPSAQKKNALNRLVKVP